MKFLGVIFAIAALFSVANAWNDLPSYCGQPCRDTQSITCAYNQRCYNFFTTLCEMKKYNCDHNERFIAVGMAQCLISPNKCRNI
uniref:Venom polypeptide n=1 Tax=Dolopus genitalis TaxID=2488630 RepID=A0A3G5BIB7_DOLGE|nr:venom polypeptide [Dolopus genitalis]